MIRQHSKTGLLALAIAATLATAPVAAQEASDPLFKYQWHLRNFGQEVFGDTRPVRGADVGIDDLHRHNIRGEGVTIAIVDDGLQIAHPDLADNVGAIAGKNFRTGSNDPTPANPGRNNHGTMVGGIAGAVGYNGIGGRGVAPAATLRGFNYLEPGAAIERALEYAWWEGDEVQDADVFNNSWGRANTTVLPTFSAMDQEAYERGLSSTRGQRGGIYVKSAGNGFRSFLLLGIFDLCNAESARLRVGCMPATFDRYNNLHNVITVGAVRADGVKASYSSVGSSLWVSAFGGEYAFQREWLTPALRDQIVNPLNYDPAIVTTDVVGCVAGVFASLRANYDHDSFNALDRLGAPDNGNCDYTAKMNGTSASAPMVSGVAALILEANPSLTYRDVKYILATTARKIDPDLAPAVDRQGNAIVPGWVTNAAGHAFSNWYGFGLVDAQAAVFKAADFEPLPALVDSGWNERELSGDEVLAIGGDRAPARFRIQAEDAASAIESVQLGFQVRHPATRELHFVLISPSGTRSVVQPAFTSISNFTSWDLLSTNAFFGESGSGEWTLEVTDKGLADGAESRGSLSYFKLRVLGH